jgi:hypothetical protein
VTVAVIALVAVPVLYLLSAGPGAYLVAEGIVDPGTYNLAYTPLVIVEQFVPEWTISWLPRYMERWVSLSDIEVESAPVPLGAMDEDEPVDSAPSESAPTAGHEARRKDPSRPRSAFSLKSHASSL